MAAYFGRLDFDPPRRRLALCYWSPRERRWLIERGAGVSGWTELHVLGEMLFGPSPWRRSRVLRVFGRLGCVEAAVDGLPEPSVDFLYEFAFEIDPDKVRGAMRAKYSARAWDTVEAAYYGGLDDG
jgi:hypothetical protein